MIDREKYDHICEIHENKISLEEIEIIDKAMNACWDILDKNIPERKFKIKIIELCNDRP